MTRPRGEVFKEFRAYCGLCGTIENTGRAYLKDAHTTLRAKGWSHTKDHGWICKECVRLRSAYEQTMEARR